MPEMNADAAGAGEPGRRAARSGLFALLALAVLALSVIPVGSAVFVLGFIDGDSPCVMCWEQRIGMALVALAGLFVLRYGPRPKYVGLGVLVGAWGAFMGLRHVGMHAARDIGQGFSVEILGAHTYTWSLLIFWVCIVTMGLLLGLTREGDLPGAGAGGGAHRSLNGLERLAMVVFLAVIAGNIVQAFASTGPPPFMGQGDPVRFSFNPRHWVWSTEEWSPAAISLRGRWAAEKPDVGSVPPDPAAGPLANLAAVTATVEKKLAPGLRGSPTDLAYDAATDRFLVTTQHGVYLLDRALDRVLRYTVVDPGYSVDLGRFGGAAFLDGHTVMALGENKSYVVLKEDDRANADANFRYFLESFDRFDEQARSRLGTVRARMMYTLSLAYDPSARSLFTVTVPNAKTKRLVVSRFDVRDLTLSEEFAPSLDAAAGLAFKTGTRSLDEYYVSGATIAGGRMYAISSAFTTLLAIDLASHEVAAAWAIRGLERPTGIALAGDTFYIVCEDGSVATVGKQNGM